MKRILVIGAGGQIGTELVPHLQKHYGEDNVIGADLKDEAVAKIGTYARAIKLDALDFNAFGQAVKDNNIDAIFNLVALLSATGEKNPELAWKINMGALVNSLTLAKEFKTAVFTPSSIGAFGVSTPHDKTPQDTVMRPDTIYGVCKVTGELLSDYFTTSIVLVWMPEACVSPASSPTDAFPAAVPPTMQSRCSMRYSRQATIHVRFPRTPIWTCSTCLTH